MVMYHGRKLKDHLKQIQAFRRAGDKMDTAKPRYQTCDIPEIEHRYSKKNMFESDTFSERS